MIEYKLEIKSNHLVNAPDAIRELASRVVMKTAHDIEAHAKIIVPVDTGNLKNSIAVEPVNDLDYIVNVGAEYGIYVELGTRFMAAQPFLGPSVTANEIPFSAAMSEVFNTDNW